MAERNTRFSGADWADQLRSIMLVGAGGIGSWTALNLSRIGHELYLIDPDTVDETNVTGGQMYLRTQIGKAKVLAVKEVCSLMGTTAPMHTFQEYYNGSEMGMTDVCVTGLDNMAARRLVYEAWKEHVQGKTTEEERKKCLLIDGRLTMEMHEVLALRGDRPQDWERYERDYLFSDEETVELACTTKQSTFGAMGIASVMTAVLCNFLTNEKLGLEFREVPFYQRTYLPLFQYKVDGEVEAPVTAPVEYEEIKGEESPEVEAVIEVAPPKDPSPSVQRYKTLLEL
jgi:molybdopterin/thiamine biosynthesis adenylyltransferase